jgi:hypothetical protein
MMHTDAEIIAAIRENSARGEGKLPQRALARQLHCTRERLRALETEARRLDWLAARRPLAAWVADCAAALETFRQLRREATDPAGPGAEEARHLAAVDGALYTLERAALGWARLESSRRPDDGALAPFGHVGALASPPAPIAAFVAGETRAA